MQSPCPHLCKSFTSSPLPFHDHHFHHLQLGFQHALPTITGARKIRSSFCYLLRTNRDGRSKVFAQSYRPDGGNSHPGNKGKVTLKGKKENIWSVDNEMAEKDKMKPKGKPKGKRRGKRLARGRKGKGDRFMVSGAMLMEIETVLQTQEPVIKPAWNTFASSVCGIWKGVGAVFSPITGEMEPIEIGNKNENLYDCYTLSRIQAMLPPSGGPASEIQRKINWVTLNPYGELFRMTESKEELKTENASSPARGMADQSVADGVLPKFESFDMKASDVMEEDIMGNEPGLVYFEDGSYSRGPVTIPVGEAVESNYYLTPTFKFEQCLVKGCHKRLRVVHTIEFANGGAEIQIMRVAVYEEQWVSPSHLADQSDTALEVKPFSQRKRTQPSELTGSWKVFEVSATPIYGEDETETGEGNDTPYVYLCTETMKKRNLPETSVPFGEEEMMDMQDVTIMWLPGGVTAYVDVKEEGILCVGVGWYSDEGINLVMERDYGLDGLLKEVRWKSEVKRRWSDPLPV
ncbi:PREDICTED: uncharacterized protein LOC104802498 [Tarenaya hassleriana]|uniref:uncharacterized protein LOC104802498 n=1 Tax=Tarenaya hassleriana TaxID=28532 RepID=UPI00053C3934|nr:PREDICTED: uncharacterized protein LOC104802498 [Tarenaya hassleriana]